MNYFSVYSCCCHVYPGSDLPT